jgi:hypothetical protein
MEECIQEMPDSNPLHIDWILSNLKKTLQLK